MEFRIAFNIHFKFQVDFEKLEMEDRATQLRKQEEERKKKKLAETRLKSLRNEMNGTWYIFY